MNRECGLSRLCGLNSVCDVNGGCGAKTVAVSGVVLKRVVFVEYVTELQ